MEGKTNKSNKRTEKMLEELLLSIGFHLFSIHSAFSNLLEFLSAIDCVYLLNRSAS